ncbi:GntR family transcriptional regulator [Sinirhodobacter populi]|uniref:GntR family transcriptional regulator n=1 Tax=Paenirhodobacter populi TaxID=2306993 RepID=A0A443JVU3_9RHOB|nr:GntR family transcriptional regulator [Sinirhodobacter populi]
MFCRFLRVWTGDDEKLNDYEPDTVADVLHAKLRARIWEGEFLPGDRVSIRALAQSSGLSVIPVRDAVRRLVAEGALRFSDSRTIEVPKLSLENHSDVLFARMQIEPETARRAYPNLTHADLDMLIAQDTAVNEAIAGNDLGRYMKANFAFHFHIYRKADAPVLMRLIEILWLQSGPSMRFIAGQYGAQTVVADYHKETTDALARRDVDGFVDALRADIAQGMEFILRARKGGIT